MKARVRKSYLNLPPKEKEVLAQYIEDQINHEEAELQKIWLQLACIVLHDCFGLGAKRLLIFLGNWKRMYRINAKLGSKEEQAAYLKKRMEKIFRKHGYPYEFIDSLEKVG